MAGRFVEVNRRADKQCVGVQNPFNQWGQIILPVAFAAFLILLFTDKATEIQRD